MDDGIRFTVLSLGFVSVNDTHFQLIFLMYSHIFMYASIAAFVLLQISSTKCIFWLLVDRFIRPEEKPEILPHRESMKLVNLFLIR